MVLTVRAVSTLDAGSRVHRMPKGRMLRIVP